MIEKQKNDDQKNVKFLSWAGIELEYPEIGVNNFKKLVSDALLGIKVNKEYINACTFEYEFVDAIHKISFYATSVQELLSSFESRFTDLSAYSPEWTKYGIDIDDGHEYYHFSVYVSDDSTVRAVNISADKYYLYVTESGMGEDRWRNSTHIFDTALFFFAYLVGSEKAILRFNCPPVDTNIKKLIAYYDEVMQKLFGNFRDNLWDSEFANRLINSILTGEKISPWFEKACIEKYQSEDKFIADLYNDIYFQVDRDLSLRLTIFDKKIRYTVVVRTEEGVIKNVDLAAEEPVSVLWVSDYEKRDVSAIVTAAIISLVCDNPYILRKNANLEKYVELAVNVIKNIYTFPWLRKKENLDKHFINSVKNKKVSNEFVNHCQRELIEIVKFADNPPNDDIYFYEFRYSCYRNIYGLDVRMLNSREPVNIFLTIENEIVMDADVSQENSRLLCTIYNYLYNFILDENELSDHFIETFLLQWDLLSWNGYVDRAVLSPDSLPYLFNSNYYRMELEFSKRLHRFKWDCYDVSNQTKVEGSIFDYNLVSTLEGNKTYMWGEMYYKGCFEHMKDILKMGEMSIHEVEANADLLCDKYSDKDVAIFKEFIRLYIEADSIFDDFKELHIAFLKYITERIKGSSVLTITGQIINTLLNENNGKGLYENIQKLKWYVEESSILSSECWYILNKLWQLEKYICENDIVLGYSKEHLTSIYSGGVIFANGGYLKKEISVYDEVVEFITSIDVEEIEEQLDLLNVLFACLYMKNGSEMVKKLWIDSIIKFCKDIAELNEWKEWEENEKWWIYQCEKSYYFWYINVFNYGNEGDSDYAIKKYDLIKTLKDRHKYDDEQTKEILSLYEKI